MSFTFEMDIGKGVLAIDIYNFISAKRNDTGGAVLIYIAGQSRYHKCTRASNNLIDKILGKFIKNCPKPGYLKKWVLSIAEYGLGLTLVPLSRLPLTCDTHVLCFQ